MNLKHGIGLDQAGEGQSASINGIESQFAHQILDHLPSFSSPPWDNRNNGNEVPAKRADS